MAFFSILFVLLAIIIANAEESQIPFEFDMFDGLQNVDQFSSFPKVAIVGIITYIGYVTDSNFRGGSRRGINSLLFGETRWKCREECEYYCL